MEEYVGRVIKIDKYYSSLPNMLKKFDKYARGDRLKATTREEYDQWKASSRQTLSELLGLDRMESVGLSPKIVETVTLEDGIIREKLLIQTEEDVWMPVYILIPPVECPKVFICPPGHQGAGKYSVAGRYDIPVVVDAIEKFNYDYGLQLARLGYVAVCPDCRGFGERRDEKAQGEDEKLFLTSSCYNLARIAEPMGETVIGMCTWDLMRLLDYVETRTEWNIGEISVLGFSGGGMQTLYFSALDDRIKRVYISGYMYGFKDSLMILNGNCSCNYVPHLWEHFDMGDIAALIAPRPLMIQSCRGDHLNGPRGLANVYEQMDIIRQAYRLFGKEERIIHDVCDGPHHFDSTNLTKNILKMEESK